MKNPLSAFRKRSWWKIGAISVAVIATTAAVATMSGAVGTNMHMPSILNI